MSVFGILISVGISLVAILVFRFVDRNERSLEKAKKYINRQREELESQLASQINRLEKEYNEVDVKQSQAVATVKNLELQIEKFNAITDQFTSRIEAVDNIGSQIEGYDKTLNQLVEMSANLEENLRRIGAESAIVDKIDKQMQSYKKNMAELERRILKISEDFSVENGNQLKQMGAELLKRFQEQIQDMEVTTAGLVEKNEAVLQHIQSDVAAVYANAAQRAQALEDETFILLKNRTQENISQLQRAFEDALVSIRNETSEKTDSLHDEIVSEISNLHGILEEKSTELDSLWNDIRGDVSEKASSSASRSCSGSVIPSLFSNTSPPSTK